MELLAKIFFSEEKQNDRANHPKNSGADNVIAFMTWLDTAECQQNVSTRVKVMIMNFQDFKKSGYKSARHDKGPKTLHEVRADIRKEEDDKKMHGVWCFEY